jgi:hypothetical protein
MKPEPLDGKILFDNTFREGDIKLAVEWLKKEIQKCIKLRQTSENVWFNSNNLRMSESYQKQKEDLQWCLTVINKAFKDVVKEKR